MSATGKTKSEKENLFFSKYMPALAMALTLVYKKTYAPKSNPNLVLDFNLFKEDHGGSYGEITLLPYKTIDDEGPLTEFDVDTARMLDTVILDLIAVEIGGTREVLVRRIEDEGLSSYILGTENFSYFVLALEQIMKKYNIPSVDTSEFAKSRTSLDELYLLAKEAGGNTKSELFGERQSTNGQHYHPVYGSFAFIMH